MAAKGKNKTAKTPKIKADDLKTLKAATLECLINNEVP